MVKEQESCNLVRLVGRLGKSVEERELPSGDVVTAFTVVVDREPSRAASASTVSVDTIPCQTFVSSLARRLTTLEAGSWVEVEGRLRRRFWRAGAGLGSAMTVDVTKLVRGRVRA